MPISEQVMRDLREIVRSSRTGFGSVAAMNDAEQLVFRTLPSLLDEVECVRRERDGTLAKDFLALYQYAAAVIASHDPALDDPELRIEGLALQVTRLAPLYDDVRRSLVTRHYPVNPAHTVNVLRDDGSTSVECDHAFLGLHPNRCAHCDKPFDELRRESVREGLRGSPRSLDFRPGPIERARPEPAGVDVVSIALGPTLLARVERLVETRRLGRTLAHVAQTLFVLGLLDAEGQDPRAHFGEPRQHISHDGVFVRFALPHEVGDDSRREILRNLFAWLHAWLGDDDRLQRSASAALEALPRT